MPHLGVTGALVLALICVGTLVWFVHHVATGINVETVIDVVHADSRTRSSAFHRDMPAPAPARPRHAGLPWRWPGRATCAPWTRRGWPPGRRRRAPWCCWCVPASTSSPARRWREVAGARGRRRPRRPSGPPSPSALHAGGGAGPRIRGAATGGGRDAGALARHQRPVHGHRRARPAGRRAVQHCAAPPARQHGRARRQGGAHSPVTDYAGLCDAMFHMIRQNAAGSPAVLIRLLEMLGRVMAVEPRAERRAELLRHAELALAAGRIGIADPADVAALEARRVGDPGGRPAAAMGAAVRRARCARVRLPPGGGRCFHLQKRILSCSRGPPEA